VNLTALGGCDSRYASTTRYPRLSGRRQILPEQLQFLVRAYKSDQIQSNWLKEHYPIRVELFNSDSGKYETCHEYTALRCTADGTIWFDGLGEAVDGMPWCIYKGNINQRPLGIRQKKIRLNLAFPADHRVFGYSRLGETGEAGDDDHPVFDADYAAAFGGPPMLYVDSPGMYHEHHQVNSVPSPDFQFAGQPGSAGFSGAGYGYGPLNRTLPPGSEEVHAINAAKRRLAGSKFPRRTSTWRMIGIRPEYTAGMWIKQITLVDPDNSDTDHPDTDYDISAAVESVTYDFQAQETIVGGLFSSITGA